MLVWDKIPKKAKGCNKKVKRAQSWQKGRKKGAIEKDCALFVSD